jgi:hypothetical protein
MGGLVRGWEWRIWVARDINRKIPLVCKDVVILRVWSCGVFVNGFKGRICFW